MKCINRSFIVSLSILLLSCGGENEAKDEKEAAGWYQFEFGVPPSSDVSNIQAKQVIIRDSIGAWLKFKANKITVNQLMARGFTSASYQDFKAEAQGANTPIWWKISEGMRFYRFEGWKKPYARSTAYLAYDEKEKTVYFLHGASD